MNWRDLPIATQVMQAKLLAAAFSVPALRGALPTGAGDTPLSLALKDLAVTYLATRSDPTQPITNRSEMPNLLMQIESAVYPWELTRAADRLGAALLGAETPDRSVRMVERLLRVSQQTVMVQRSLGNEKVAGGLVDLGFAYGRLNPTTVTDAGLLATLPFQQLWQATDAAGVAAARPGIEAFFGAFEGTLAQQTLVQNQAYLLDRIRLDGLLSPQELRDPSQIHNVMATGTYLFTPNLPSDESGGGSGGLAPGGTPAGGTTSPILAPVLAPAATPAGGTGTGFVPASPGLSFAPGIPASILQIPNNILGDRFYNPDGSPKSSSELLTWRVDVPVHFSLWSHFNLGQALRRPSDIHRFWVTSYGGVQVKRVMNNSMVTSWPYADNRQWVVYTAVNSKGELVTGRSDINTGLWYFWEPEFGLGTVTLVPQVNPPLSGEAQLSGGLSGVGSLAPNVGDPEWAPSPPPQPGDPGSRPMPPGTETKPLPNGGTAPVKPSPVRPNNPQKPGDGPNFPPEGEPLPPRKPIEEMSPLEALWDSWMRAIDQLPPELRAWARIQLGNLALQGAAAGLLLLFLLGGAIATRAAASALSLLGVGTAGLLVLGLAKVAEAIWSKSSAALDEAVNFFARWAREAQSSMSPDALAQKIGELTGSLESIPVFGKYVKLLNTVGSGPLNRAIQQGELVKLNAIADRLAAIKDPSVRGALQQAISSTPGAGDAIIQAGPGAIDDINIIVNQYGTTHKTVVRVLSQEGMTVSELKGFNQKGLDPVSLLELLEESKLTVAEIKLTSIKGLPAEIHELPQAIRFGKLQGGGEFEFTGSTQGVEGVFRFTNQPGVDVPVSFKSFHDVDRIGNLLKEIRRNSNSAQAVNIKDAIFYGEPIQFTADQLADFSRNGPLYQRIIHDGAFKRIILKASDGVVEINRNGVSITR